MKTIVTQASTSRSYRLGRTSCLALLAASLSTAPAFAQSDPDAEVIVVTGVAAPVDYEKLGNSLTVIDGELIEDQGYSYVPDVLRQIPGVAVNRTGPLGGQTQVRIRGAEGNHTLVLLDGFDITSPDQGEMDFSTLLAGDIERIEVLRGPQSGLYGSNALAGVVNIITRRELNGPYASGSIEAGEMNTYQLQAGGGFGNGTDYGSIGFHTLTTDGFDTSPSTAALGVPAVGINGVSGDEEDNHLTTAYVRAGKSLSNQLRVDGILRYLHKDSGLDGQAFSAPIAGLAYDDASRTSTDSYLIGGDGTLDLLDGRWTTVASLSYFREERRGVGTSFSASGFASAPLVPNGADATRSKATVKSTFEFGSSGFLSFLTGFLEAKEETYKNPCEAACTLEQRAKQSRELFGLGIQYRAEIADQLYLLGTLRHNENDDFKDDDTYSVSASWIIPGTGSRPHASIGTGITNPTFFEQFGFNPGTFVGNPSLLPEKAEGWDIGFEQSLLGGRLVLDLTYFESTLESEIFTASGGPPTFPSTPANRSTDSDRSGWEATVRYSPNEDLDLFASWTSLDAAEPAGIEVRRPESQGSLDATWRIGGGPLRLNLGVTHNGEQYDTDFATFLRTRQDAYTTIRAGASYQIDDNIEVYGRIENLTDETYQEIIGYLGSPRAIYLGVRFKDGERG
jgi:vitamin B12 transporter